MPCLAHIKKATTFKLLLFITFYFPINCCVQTFSSSTYPTPICVKSPFKIFSLCPGLFIHPFTTSSGELCPLAIFSPSLRFEILYCSIIFKVYPSVWLSFYIYLLFYISFFFFFL